MKLHRIEVRSKPGHINPRAESVKRDAATLGLADAPDEVEQADVYLIEADLDEHSIERLATELLADPVTQQATIGAAGAQADAYIEVQPLPGVMDPAGQAVELAIHAMLGVRARVQTGQRYDLHGVDQSTDAEIARRALANTVVHAVHEEPFHPESLPRGAKHDFDIVEVPIRDLDDEALQRLSREAHLFLSLEEMQAIRDEYRALGREPREIELETLAQTWSEHCVHKTLKSTITYREVGNAETPKRRNAEIHLPSPSSGGGRGVGGEGIDFRNRPGHTVNDDGSVTIDNLLRSTVAAATKELMADGVDWCLSVFVDNAGIIAFDDQHAVCFKCETHNHPSAIEPYGGAATGIGGCIRDIIGTGLAAKPIAATDVFCVAYPDHFTTEVTEGTERDEYSDDKTSPSSVNSVSSVMQALPQGCLHPRRILQQVVHGVRDYGNRMGIPTLNGTVWFDDRYVGNPLVFCGTVGVMPRDRIAGEPQPGDRIIAIGGRTGRDGIHGATFSSAELTDTHADEFAHAVQIGNPVTEKVLLDAILEARDHRDGPLFSAITDCGAGGFSSAIGEMGEKLGAHVHLENAPLKYEGLSPTEIWISEAQERMVLAVPPDAIEKLRAICNRQGAEMSDLGHFGTDGAELILTWEGTEVGRLPMHFLHEGLPMPHREAVWQSPPNPVGQVSGPVGQVSDLSRIQGSQVGQVSDLSRFHRLSEPMRVTAAGVDHTLTSLLAHPNIASKRWIIRQYDHEVQGNTIVKPLVGSAGEGPSDAAVVMPVEQSERALAIGNGLATGLAADPYLMTLAAIDECIRNLVCVGADPSRIAILDNFCWPSCRKPANLGGLVRAAEGCYDGAKAYRTPFISGKDSLNNQFTTEDGRTIEIPPTLLISGFGIVPDVTKCLTMDAKRPGNALVIVGPTAAAMGGSHAAMLSGDVIDDASLPVVDLELGPRIARAVHDLIMKGFVRSAHDCSEGGLLVAAAEMCIASGLGVRLHPASLPVRNDNDGGELPLFARLFSETPSRYLLEVEDAHVPLIREALGDIPHAVIGEFDDAGVLAVPDADVSIAVDDLRSAWQRTLDW